MKRWVVVVGGVWVTAAVCYLTLHLAAGNLHDAGPGLWGLLIIFIAGLLFLGALGTMPGEEDDWSTSTTSLWLRKRRRKRKAHRHHRDS